MIDTGESLQYLKLPRVIVVKARMRQSQIKNQELMFSNLYRFRLGDNRRPNGNGHHRSYLHSHVKGATHQRRNYAQNPAQQDYQA